MRAAARLGVVVVALDAASLLGLGAGGRGAGDAGVLRVGSATVVDDDAALEVVLLEVVLLDEGAGLVVDDVPVGRGSDTDGTVTEGTEADGRDTDGRDTDGSGISARATASTVRCSRSARTTAPTTAPTTTDEASGVVSRVGSGDVSVVGALDVVSRGAEDAAPPSVEVVAAARCDAADPRRTVTGSSSPREPRSSSRASDRPDPRPTSDPGPGSATISAVGGASVAAGGAEAATLSTVQAEATTTPPASRTAAATEAAIDETAGPGEHGAGLAARGLLPGRGRGGARGGEGVGGGGRVGGASVEEAGQAQAGEREGRAVRGERLRGERGPAQADAHVLGGRAVGGVVRGHGLEQRDDLEVEALGDLGTTLEALAGGGQRRALVRRAPGEGLDHDEAERVDVGGRAHGLAADLLGGEVGRGADDDAGVGDAGGVGDEGDTEVGEVGPPVAVEEDVAGRDVAVQDAGPVDVTERVGHRRHGQQRLGDRERAVGETVGQVAALEQRHHDEGPAVHAADVVDGHEVRVVHRRGQRDLALDARVVGHREDLHGGVAVEEEIVGAVDLGARAPADQLAEGEALTETLGQGSRRRRGRGRNPTGPSSTPRTRLRVPSFHHAYPDRATSTYRVHEFG